MRIARRTRPDPYGLLVFCVGLLALAEVFVRHIPVRLEPLFDLLPNRITHWVLFIAGLLLIYLSEQISRRKRNAWYFTTVLLAVLIVVSVAKRFEPIQVISYLLVFILFIKKRKQFVVRSDSDSFRRGMIVAVAQLIGAMILVGIIFVIIDQREFGQRLTTGQTLHVTINALAGKPLPHYLHPTKYDRTLIDLLRLTGIVSITLFFVSLFRPLRLRGASSAILQSRAVNITKQYGKDSEDFFKLYPKDKHYFFYGDSYVAYMVKNGVALIVDGACGRPADVLRVREAFAEYCRLNSWHIALVHCDALETTAWQPYGLETLQIGSEAIIDSTVFVNETRRSKHFRYIYNRALKDSLAVSWWHTPLSDEQLDTLKHISDAWLAHGKQEYTFIMAPFSEDYIRGCTIAVLTCAGVPIGYANLIPTFGGISVASIDHMRSLPNTSSVAMHFLLANCVEATYEKGFSHFNLGFVPLAKLMAGSPNLTNRLLALVRRLGSRFYSSEGLEQFKGKFEPDWSPRYLAYQGGLRQLPLSANALRQAIAYKTTRKSLLPAVLMSLSGICYASFPFAWFLNRPYTFHGLTSDLGGNGQPYAWLFNLSDILSGLIAVTVLSWLYIQRRPRERLLRWTVIIATIGSICTTLAAGIPIPKLETTAINHLTLGLLNHPIIIAHGTASFINSAAFVSGAVIWAYCSQTLHRKHKVWRWLYALTVVMMSTIGFIIGQWSTGAGDVIQRLFIILYAVWFVLLVIDLQRNDEEPPIRNASVTGD